MRGKWFVAQQLATDLGQRVVPSVLVSRRHPVLPLLSPQLPQHAVHPARHGITWPRVRACSSWVTTAPRTPSPPRTCLLTHPVSFMIHAATLKGRYYNPQVIAEVQRVKS
jgi:hypothetical protein